MMFSRQSLGIEINQNGVSFALMSASGSSRRLDRVARNSFAPDTIRVSIREPNIISPQQFCDAVRNAYNTLLTAVDAASISLPDSAGKVVLMDMEGRFKTRAEGLDMIRWKLKKTIPLDVGDIQLDYQQLGIRENGDMSLLVALTSKGVIMQYEEILAQVGIAAVKLDFTSFNLFRTFDAYLDYSDSALFISFYDGTLGVMIFSDGTLEFIRTKDLSGSMPTDSRVFMEINSSLLAFREKNRDAEFRTVYCLAPPATSGDFCAMVAEATAAEPLLVETKSVIMPGDGAPGDQETLYAYTAAIGAAARSL